MSKNQGKDGEMVVCVIAASMSYHEDGVEFTRPSVTNSADMGADLFLRHPPGFLDKVLQIANGTYLPPSPDALKDSESPGVNTKAAPAQKTRFDVKTTSGKLSCGQVDKYIADIHKHPDCTGHVLVGGSGLTKLGKQKMTQAQQNFQEHGLTLAHVNNDGVGRLGECYRPPAPRLDPGPYKTT